MPPQPSEEIGHILLELMCDPALHKQLILDTLALQPDLSVRNRRHETPLLMAAAMQNNPLLNIFAQDEKGLNDTLPNGNTALMISAIAGNIEGIETLIKAGADVTMKNDAGYDAFDLAECHGGAPVTAAIEKSLNDRKDIEYKQTLHIRIDNGMPFTQPLAVKKIPYPRKPQP